MNTTKITLKIRNDILEGFNQRLDSCFLKRDAFLNYMLKSETQHLRDEMQGLKLSAMARRYISHQLMYMEKTTINVVVEKETAEDLKQVLRETNIVRDAFANRLMLMLISPDSLLRLLGLPVETTDYSLRSPEPMPTSPLASILAAIGDPFYYFRSALMGTGESIYRLRLPERFESLACYLEDAYVPETEAWHQRIAGEKTLLEMWD